METKKPTLNLMSLYHLTYDPNNDTGYTLEEVAKLIEKHGPDHEVEATITVGLNPVDVTATEVVDPAQLESAPEEKTLEEKIAEGYNPDAKDGDGDGIVQEGTEWERPVGTEM